MVILEENTVRPTGNFMSASAKGISEVPGSYLTFAADVSGMCIAAAIADALEPDLPNGAGKRSGRRTFLPCVSRTATWQAGSIMK